MDISNTVLQTLSGFKQVYVGMTHFLQETNEETRAILEQELSRQSAALNAAGAGLVGKEGEAEIREAIAGTAAIEDCGIELVLSEIIRLLPIHRNRHDQPPERVPDSETDV